MTDARKAVIEAIRGTLKNVVAPPWFPDWDKHTSTAALDACLALLPGLGLAVVPTVATENMISAGWIDKEDVDPGEIWQAMGAAAPSPLAEAPKDG